MIVAFVIDKFNHALYDRKNIKIHDDFFKIIRENIK